MQRENEREREKERKKEKRRERERERERDAAWPSLKTLGSRRTLVRLDTAFVGLGREPDNTETQEEWQLRICHGHLR